MTTASICTIGDEILIGQIVDTNSSHIARKLEESGVMVTRMVSFGDERTEIISTLKEELRRNDIVVVTGGLGPTKDDITKNALAELSGSTGWKEDAGQIEIIHRILRVRGIDAMPINLAQALVPDTCEVIQNQLGTAPVMVFRLPPALFGHPCTLYSLPGVPFEALGALDEVVADIKSHFTLESITHKTVMTFGIPESSLAKMLEDWENALPKDMHLAYLPNSLTGVRLRLSVYGGGSAVDGGSPLLDGLDGGSDGCGEDGGKKNCDGSDGSNESAELKRLEAEFAKLRPILGDALYAKEDSNLQKTIGQLLRSSGKTLSVAESCTGGLISQLITSVAGASDYYLGSVTSYANSVKENVLGVPAEIIEKYGAVSSECVAAMAEGVRRLTGSDFSVATSGIAGPGGGTPDKPVGLVWIGVSSPTGTHTASYNSRSDRARNIERFASAALDLLRKEILSVIR